LSLRAEFSKSSFTIFFCFLQKLTDVSWRGKLLLQIKLLMIDTCGGFRFVLYTPIELRRVGEQCLCTNCWCVFVYAALIADGIGSSIVSVNGSSSDSILVLPVVWVTCGRGGRKAVCALQV
jgi:hypothetical protein